MNGNLKKKDSFENWDRWEEEEKEEGGEEEEEEGVKSWISPTRCQEAHSWRPTVSSLSPRFFPEGLQRQGRSRWNERRESDCYIRANNGVSHPPPPDRLQWSCFCLTLCLIIMLVSWFILSVDSLGSVDRTGRNRGAASTSLRFRWIRRTGSWPSSTAACSWSCNDQFINQLIKRELIATYCNKSMNCFPNFSRKNVTYLLVPAVFGFWTVSWTEGAIWIHHCEPWEIMNLFVAAQHTTICKF